MSIYQVELMVKIIVAVESNTEETAYIKTQARKEIGSWFLTKNGQIAPIVANENTVAVLSTEKMKEIVNQ